MTRSLLRQAVLRVDEVGPSPRSGPRLVGTGSTGRPLTGLPDGMSLATGCKIYEDCLTCPLPSCIYDEALATQVFKAKLGEIYDLYDSGYSFEEVAQILGYKRHSLYEISSDGGRRKVDKNYTKNKFLLELAKR